MIEINHNDCIRNHDCACEQVRVVKSYSTKLMDWGPAIQVGQCMYVIEKEVKTKEDYGY